MSSTFSKERIPNKSCVGFWAKKIPCHFSWTTLSVWQKKSNQIKSNECVSISTKAGPPYEIRSGSLLQNSLSIHTAIDYRKALTTMSIYNWVNLFGAITILQVLSSTITIHLFRFVPLQFWSCSSRAIFYVVDAFGSTHMSLYFCMDQNTHVVALSPHYCLAGPTCHIFLLQSHYGPRQ